MRTTVTLDQDSTLRAALGRVPSRSDRPAFVLTARPLGLRAGIDPTSFNKLADELEADAFREQHTRVTGPPCWSRWAPPGIS